MSSKESALKREDGTASKAAASRAPANTRQTGPLTAQIQTDATVQQTTKAGTKLQVDNPKVQAASSNSTRSPTGQVSSTRGGGSFNTARRTTQQLSRAEERSLAQALVQELTVYDATCLREGVYHKGTLTAAVTKTTDVLRNTVNNELYIKCVIADMTGSTRLVVNSEINAQIMKNMFRRKGIRIELSNFRREDQALIANKDSKIKMMRQNVPQFEEVDFDNVICDPLASLDQVDRLPEGKRMSLSGIITEVDFQQMPNKRKATVQLQSPNKKRVVIQLWEPMDQIVQATHEGAKVKMTDLKKCPKVKEDRYGKGWPLLDANASTQIVLLEDESNEKILRLCTHDKGHFIFTDTNDVEHKLDVDDEYQGLIISTSGRPIRCTLEDRRIISVEICSDSDDE